MYRRGMEGSRSTRNRAVAVTSLGATTTFGRGVEVFWRSLLEGRTGIGPIPRFPGMSYRARLAALVPGGGVPGGMVEAQEAQEARDAASLAWEAVAEALGPVPCTFEPERTAVVVGTTMGANGSLVDWLRRRGGGSPPPGASLSSVASGLSEALGALGPSLTVSVACASGTLAIGLGADLIRSGEADVVVAGGVDVFSEFVFAGFDSLRALSIAGARPFDRRRDGLSLGEGAGFVLLEEVSGARRRGRVPLAYVAGYGSAADAHHMTRPSPSGEGLVRAVSSALNDAGASPGEIGFVSTHGTGTVFNDRMEAAAFGTLFGEAVRDLPVNSIKGAIGHTLGAAGALEAILSVLVLSQGAIPPTSGFEVPDPACPLDVVFGSPRPLAPSCRYVLSTSSAFAGTNAALVLERA